MVLKEINFQFLKLNSSASGTMPFESLMATINGMVGSNFLGKEAIIRSTLFGFYQDQSNSQQVHQEELRYSGAFQFGVVYFVVCKKTDPYEPKGGSVLHSYYNSTNSNLIR